MIIGLAGKKGAGKDSVARYIYGKVAVKRHFCRYFEVNTNNELIVNSSVDFTGLEKYVALFAFADTLRDIVSIIFGIDRNDTLVKKDAFTKYKWEDMPTNVGKSGYMTVRDILQYFGTDIARKINNDCWIDATFENINTVKSKLSIITDVRFVNEVEAIKRAGGKVIKLTRGDVNDTHISENDLNSYNNFDMICDNRFSSIVGQGELVWRYLMRWGVV